MKIVSTLWKEFFGLFVDDGVFAICILAWLALMWLAVSHLGLPPIWAGLALFAGLAGTLIHSTSRRARGLPR